MNKRIKLLAEQAGITTNLDTNYFEKDINKWMDYYSDKFAELIIQECIEQVRGEFLPVLEDETMMKDTHWDGYVQCGVDSVVAIREHFFGVEL
jgi:hypothetical protein